MAAAAFINSMKARAQRSRVRPPARRASTFTAAACAAFLDQHCFGHLVLARGTHVDAVPIRFAFLDGWLYFGANAALRNEVGRNVWVAVAVAAPMQRDRWASIVARGTCYATEHTGTAAVDAAALRGIVRLREQAGAAKPGAHRAARTSVVFRMHVEEMHGRMIDAPCPAAKG
jgi:nitroimidazol reductase NimA-like FMN-containing flavoprotein (pyridoxamine 5'-phosphate oxidase superfamily)